MSSRLSVPLEVAVPRTASAAPAGAATRATPRSPPSRNTIVVTYIVLSLLALAPGLALKYGYEVQGLGSQRGALADIQFGSGLRFWFGVTGASMMALLILYPLRKAFAKARGLGSVAAWFHVHILFGLIGPVLILYHSNFGLGGSNANVALWSMLVVAGSGIIGYFVYARVSRDFYSATQQARRHRDTILAALPDFDPVTTWKQNLTAKLEGFEADLLTPRQGVIASVKARLRVERWKRDLLHDVAWIVVEVARRQGLDYVADRQLRALIGSHARAYFGFARSAASQSVREQLWARWRLFHLPVCLLMIAATILHIIAVWDMDASAPAAGRQASVQETQVAAADPRDPVEAFLRGDTSPRVAPVPRQRDTDKTKPALPNVAIEQRVRIKVENPVASPAIEPTPKAAANESAVLAARAAGMPVKIVKTQDLNSASHASEAPAPAAAIARDEPTSAPTPKLVMAPTPVPAPAPVLRAIEPAKVAALPPRAAVPPVAVAAATPPPAAVPDMKAVYSELQRRTDTQPMGLGGAKPRTLFEQITELKARQKAGQFAHAQAETGFALTGKHVKVDCVDCHQKPLTETPSSNPRQCIACHKADDIHRGRRPDCANCHTTNRWSQIIRRK